MNATGNWLTPLVMHPVHDTILLIGKAQVWRTLNAGTSFAQVGNLVGGAGNVVAMAYAPSNPNYIYVARSNRMFLTIDGTNFNDVTGTLPVAAASISAITVSGSDPNKAWVTFSGYSAANKVWQTVDAGVTWSAYTTGLPNLPVNTIVYQNGSNDGLYVGTDVGVYFRDNSLASWQPFMTNLPNVDVHELEICYLNGKLRAATSGRGLWETDLAVPLPVGLQSLTAECNHGKVLVQWSTAVEVSNDYFTVERSVDGARFEAIGTVDGAGYSDHLVAYSFTDAEPLWQVAYYRLRQTDIDGTTKYSKILSAGCNNQLHVTVFPNPNNGRFTIRGEAALSSVELRNVLGELVYRSDVEGTEIVVDLQAQAKGIYFYKVAAANGAMESGKIVVR